MIYRAAYVLFIILPNVCYASQSDSAGYLSFTFYAMLVGIPSAWIWNKFIRLRCPQCKTVKPSLLNEEELDSWRGTKSVSERLGSGKTRTRHVSTTYAKVKRTYECTACRNVWDVVKKEEK